MQPEIPADADEADLTIEVLRTITQLHSVQTGGSVTCMSQVAFSLFILFYSVLAFFILFNSHSQSHSGLSIQVGAELATSDDGSATFVAAPQYMHICADLIRWAVHWLHDSAFINMNAFVAASVAGFLYSGHWTHTTTSVMSTAICSTTRS